MLRVSAAAHAAASRLGRAVRAVPSRARWARGSIILNEPELHLRGDVLVPDWRFAPRTHAGSADGQRGWLVDPLLQTLEVLRLDGAGHRIAGVGRAAVVQCEALESLAIPLTDLWSA